MTSPGIQDFIPEDQWPAVSTMLEGFGEQTLPASDALAGSTLSLPEDDDLTTDYVFADGSTMTWTTTAGNNSRSGTAAYKAIEARPGIFIIDAVRGEGAAADNLTIILDRNSGAVTTGKSTFVTVDGKVRSTTTFSQANINGGSELHQRSAGLVGKRVYYRYSDVEAYEHIYLSPGTFTWHCIRGGEAGLADTDRSMTWDVADDLFIFFWTEKVMAVEAMLLVDLREQRSIGRMFGWDNSTTDKVVLPFNSRLSVLNITKYPQDNHKH